MRVQLTGWSNCTGCRVAEPSQVFVYAFPFDAKLTSGSCIVAALEARA